MKNTQNANNRQIFKKGMRMDKANYRQISLTSVVGKILEGIIRDEYMNFLVTNNIISKEQEMFVPNKNYITNLLETLDFISKSMSYGNRRVV